MRLLLLYTFVFGFIWPFSASRAAEFLEVGAQAPNWVLADVDGQPVSLYQQAESGNTTVMVFFASWCGKCQKLLPYLNQLQRQTVDEPLRFYLLNIWEDPDPAAIAEIEPTDIPILLRAENVARRFQVETTPGVVVVGPEKTVLYKRVSGTSVEDTVTQLKDLLQQP